MFWGSRRARPRNVEIGAGVSGRPDPALGAGRAEPVFGSGNRVSGAGKAVPACWKGLGRPDRRGSGESCAGVLGRERQARPGCAEPVLGSRRFREWGRQCRHAGKGRHGQSGSRESRVHFEIAEIPFQEQGKLCWGVGKARPRSGESQAHFGIEGVLFQEREKLY